MGIDRPWNDSGFPVLDCDVAVVVPNQCLKQKVKLRLQVALVQNHDETFMLQKISWYVQGSSCR